MPVGVEPTFKVCWAMAGFEFHRLPVDSGEEVVGPFKVLLGEFLGSLFSCLLIMLPCTEFENDFFVCFRRHYLIYRTCVSYLRTYPLLRSEFDRRSVP